MQTQTLATTHAFASPGAPGPAASEPEVSAALDSSMASRAAHFALPMPRRYSPIGIDFGRHGIRAAQWSRQGSTLRLKVATLSVPGDDDSPRSVEPDAPRNARAWSLQRLLTRAGVTRRPIVFGLTPPDFELHPLEIPAVSTSAGSTVTSGQDPEIDQAMHYELARLLRFDPDDVQTDWWPLPAGSRSKTTVMGVAVPRSTIQAMLELSSASGFPCERIDISACAFSRLGSAFIRPARDEIWGILDLAGASARLTICAGSIPLMLRKLDLGGARFTKLVAEALGVSEGTAEQLKRQYGLPLQLGLAAHSAEHPHPLGELDGGPHQTVTRVIAKATRADLERMLLEIEKSFGYVLGNFTGHHPGGLLLVGSGSEWTNLDLVLQHRLGVEVVRFDVLCKAAEADGTLRIVGPQRSRLCLGSAAAAIGLAMIPTR